MIMEIFLHIVKNPSKARCGRTSLIWSKYILGGLWVGYTQGNGCFFYCHLSLKHYFQHEYEHFFIFKPSNLFNLNWIQGHYLGSFSILENHELHRIKQSIKYVWSLWNIIQWNYVMQNPLWRKRKGETECRFIRRKNYLKHSILIRSDDGELRQINGEWWQTNWTLKID